MKVDLDNVNQMVYCRDGSSISIMTCRIEPSDECHGAAHDSALVATMSLAPGE